MEPEKSEATYPFYPNRIQDRNGGRPGEHAFPVDPHAILRRIGRCDRCRNQKRVRRRVGRRTHPDQVRGTFGTLREAVLANNWPTLGDTRGKVVFMMQGGMVPFYKQGHPSLQGRAMFTYAEPDEDEAAFVIINNPIADFGEIRRSDRPRFYRAYPCGCGNRRGPYRRLYDDERRHFRRRADHFHRLLPTRPALQNRAGRLDQLPRSFPERNHLPHQPRYG